VAREGPGATRGRSPWGRRALIATLLRRCPALSLGPHGTNVVEFAYWQPVFIITNHAWDTAFTEFDATALHIYIVAWRYTPSEILALDFYNNQCGARLDEPLLRPRWGNPFMNAINRFQHEIDGFRKKASEPCEHVRINLHLKARTYRGFWVKPHGDEVQYDEDGTSADAGDLDGLVLRELRDRGE
jgi:hypothetical protein